MAIEIRKARIVKKVWGHEEILVREDEDAYCGKLLHLNKRYRCSIHKHPKAETFYILYGHVYIEVSEAPDKMNGEYLNEGDIIDIPENFRHRFSG